MSGIKEGQEAISFCLPDENEKEVCLKDFSGQWVVLYFYPKDNTSGCTLEAIHFTNKLDDFEKNNAVVIGVSPDSPKSHCGFREKHDLKVLLLSDSDHQVIERYGAWVLKKMYGREYYGVERNTFLINPKGEMAVIWRKVKVDGHIEEVFERLKTNQSK